ncbi:MAG: hypothetical protein ABWY93_18540 [Mycobacterium sp.]
MRDPVLPAPGRTYLIAAVNLALLGGLGQFVVIVQRVSAAARTAGEPFTWSLFWPKLLDDLSGRWPTYLMHLAWLCCALVVFYSWGAAAARNRAETLQREVDELLQGLTRP